MADTATALGPIPRRPRIRRTEVDGVPTFYPQRPAPGPLRATLLFRVGRADEPLPRGGITHLVEHLSLGSLPGHDHGHDHAHNGFVEAHRTALYTAGTAEEVVAFLAQSTAGLSDLSCERLENERRILSVEAQSRGSSTVGTVLAFRYGATGVGNLGYDEFGLRWLEDEHVKEWAAKYFTRDNAVLWLSGPPPPETALHLGAGRRMPIARPETWEINLPALVRQASNFVAFGLNAPYKRDASLLMRVAERRLQTRLRHEGGLSYQIGTAVQVVDAERMEFVLAADTLPEGAGEAIGHALAVFEELAEHGPSDAELARDAQIFCKAMADANAVFGWLDGYADRALFDEPEPLTPKEFVDQTLNADKAQLASYMGEALDSLVAVVPHEVDVPDWRWMPDSFSRTTVIGRAFSTKVPQSHSRLVVGTEGVSLVLDSERFATVRFDDCAALAAWDDGTRCLFGQDGYRIVVTPWTWAAGHEAVGMIDAAIGGERRIPMGPGDGPPEAPERRAAFGSRQGRRAAWAVWVVFSAVAALIPLSVAPAPDPREVDVQSPQLLLRRDDGSVDCGTSSNFKAAFGDDLVVPVPPGQADALREACASDALENVTIGGLGALSLAGALVTAAVFSVRSRRQKKAVVPSN